MSSGGRRPFPEPRHRRDEHPSRARPAPDGGLQEAARLAAARSAAIARAVGAMYAAVLDQPLPDDHAALVERLRAGEAARR